MVIKLWGKLNLKIYCEQKSQEVLIKKTNKIKYISQNLVDLGSYAS